MRRGFLLDAGAQSSGDLRVATKKIAKLRERLTSIAWERVRHLRPSSGAAIVVWASSNCDLLNRDLTNGDLLKLMPVSRSVSTALAKVEARAFAEFEATNAGSELEEAMWNWWTEDVEPSETSEVFPHQGPATTVERVRRICWGDFLQEMKKVKATSRKSIPQGKSVKVTLKKTSGEIWIETEPLPVLCNMARIVFDVAGVDRRDTVVPYLIYDAKVQPYWKSLVHFPAVRNGCQALEMTVVLQPKETPIAVLFGRVKPLNEDDTDMSFETFRNCLIDPKDERYMDMERLMNNIYPVDAASLDDIWLWKSQLQSEIWKYEPNEVL